MDPHPGPKHEQNFVFKNLIKVPGTGSYQVLKYTVAVPAQVPRTGTVGIRNEFFSISLLFDPDPREPN